MASARTGFAVERREDPDRELGGAATIRQPEQLVKVIAAVARDRLGQRVGESGLPQALNSPREDACSVACRAHLSF
jgi:hypothetical protein